MASQGTAATTSHDRPYQGYPYVTPIVTDVPSLSADAVSARWKDLPRKQISSGFKQPTPSSSGKREPEQNLVVYIELPEHSENHNREGNGDSEEFVQETIFYDPFDDRRINVNKDERGTEPNLESVSSIQSNRPPRPPPPNSSSSTYGTPRPRPPSTLVLSSPGSYASSANSSTDATSATALPSWMSKEAQIYNPVIDDGFNLNPLQVAEFPEPPPSYADIDRISSPAPSTIVEQPRVEPQVIPPRTQVITHDPSPQSLPGSQRKFLNCQHCGYRVHSLVLRQSGTATHVLAATCFLMCLFPLSILIYCTDWCKYKNHYCPSCNNKIGYEVPMLCQKFVHSK